MGQKAGVSERRCRFRDGGALAPLPHPKLNDLLWFAQGVRTLRIAGFCGNCDACTFSRSGARNRLRRRATSTPSGTPGHPAGPLRAWKSAEVYKRVFGAILCTVIRTNILTA